MHSNFNTVCVIGLGYVGLPTAATLAACGIKVIAVDVDEDRVKTVNTGSVATAEPGLGVLVRTALKAGNLRAQLIPEPADAFIIAVPTPHDENNAPDVSHVRSVGHSIAPVLKEGDLVVLESTCPVGTTEGLCALLAKRRCDLSFPHIAGEGSDVRVAYSAERAIPGHLLQELIHNERVIGGITNSCAATAAELYQVFVRGSCHLTDVRTAELTKLVENAYRDVNIAFANEISIVCDGLGIEPWDLISLANRHPRVNILQPGPGVGGHCIPVDPWFIVHSAPDTTPLIRAARGVNSEKPRRVADQAIAACRTFDKPIVACLGLSYKANVGDLRESPAIAVVAHLQAASIRDILVVEPYIDALPKALATVPKPRLVPLETAINTAHIVLLLTDHSEFRSLAPNDIINKVFIDTRGMLRS